jgi:uncharacterized integral membrane protein
VAYLILAFIFAIIIMVFSLQNLMAVSVRFIVWESQDIPLALVILGSAFLGALITFTLGLTRSYKLKRNIKILETSNQVLRQRIKVAEAAIPERQGTEDQSGS